MFSILLILLCVFIILIHKVVFTKDSLFISPIFFILFSQLMFFLDPPRFFTEYSSEVLIYHFVNLTLLFITISFLTLKFLNKDMVYEKNFNFNEIYFLYSASFFLCIPFIIFILSGADIFSILTRFYKNSIFEDGNLEKYSTIINLITRSVYLLLIISRFVYNFTEKKSYKNYWYVFLLLSIITVVSTGVRSGLIYLFLSIILVDICCYKNILSSRVYRNIFAYAGIAAFIIPAIFILSQFRSTDFSDFSDFKSNINFESVTNSSAVEDESFYNLNDMVAFSINKYSTEPCILCSIETILVTPVPRFFWSDKPVGFGKQLAHDMVGAPLNGPGLSLAAGMPGESVYNLGWMGLIVFPIIFGIFLSIAFGILKYSKNIFLASCSLFFLISFIGTFRGDWMAISAFFINCLFVYIVIFLSKKISKMKI